MAAKTCPRARVVRPESDSNRSNGGGGVAVVGVHGVSNRRVYLISRALSGLNDLEDMPMLGDIGGLS